MLSCSSLRHTKFVLKPDRELVNVSVLRIRGTGATTSGRWPSGRHLHVLTTTAGLVHSFQICMPVFVVEKFDSHSNFQFTIVVSFKEII